jgi:hypothetical protein
VAIDLYFTETEKVKAVHVHAMEAHMVKRGAEILILNL